MAAAQPGGLYHHGIADRRDLLTTDKRRWLEQLELPDGAREQITVALRVIDALDAQSEPLTRERRAYGHPPPGCRALTRHYVRVKKGRALPDGRVVRGRCRRVAGLRSPSVPAGDPLVIVPMARMPAP